MAMDGQYGTIGATGETFYEHLTRLSEDAKAVVAVGTVPHLGEFLLLHQTQLELEGLWMW